MSMYISWNTLFYTEEVCTQPKILMRHNSYTFAVVIYPGYYINLIMWDSECGCVNGLKTRSNNRGSILYNIDHF